jgi:O-methyltransferase
MNTVQTIQSLAKRLGFTIVRLPSAREYERVQPLATFSPWNKDDQFQTVFAAIKEFTLVDKYRCFELWALIEQASKLKSGSIIEVGVWRGGTGALISQQARLCAIQEKVFLCDTFSGVAKAGENDSTYKGGEHADTSRKTVEGLLARMNLSNVEILEGTFPDDTGRQVEDLQFRFCHIDVDAYQSAKDIIDWIWDRMVPGGIVVYDDYGFYDCQGITKHVEEQRLLRDRLVVHNLNGHAVIVKLPPK